MEKAARDAAGVHLRAGSFADLGQGRAHPSGERRSGTVRIVAMTCQPGARTSNPANSQTIVVYFTHNFPLCIFLARLD